MDSKKISMYQGENKSIVFSVTQKDGTPKILEDGTAKFVIVSGDVLKLQKELNNGLLISGNVITVLIDSADTIALLGNYSFELRAIDKDDISNVVSRGTIEIRKSFTL